MIGQHVPHMYDTWLTLLLSPPCVQSRQLVKINWRDLDSGERDPDGSNDLGWKRKVLPKQCHRMMLSHLHLLVVNLGDHLTPPSEGISLLLPPLELLHPCPLPLLIALFPHSLLLTRATQHSASAASFCNKHKSIKTIC